MIFNFKKKKITVDCFTHLSPLYELFPPKKAANFFPEWWKTLPKTFTDSSNTCKVDVEYSTMRHCHGIIDWYKFGFIIPIWSELYIKVTEDNYKFMCSNGGLSGDEIQGIQEHGRDQYGPQFDNFFHGKILVPWLFNEKRGVKFQLSYPIWNHVDKWSSLQIVPGVINFKQNHRPHVNVFLSRSENVIHFDPGDPLVYFFPLSDNDVEIKTHLITQDEYVKMDSVNGYNLSYRQRQVLLDKFIKQNKKCPFV